MFKNKSQLMILFLMLPVLGEMTFLSMSIMGITMYTEYHILFDRMIHFELGKLYYYTDVLSTNRRFFLDTFMPNYHLYVIMPSLLLIYIFKKVSIKK